MCWQDKISIKVELKGTTCLGHCASGGANLKVEDEVVEGITKENFNDFFQEKVLNQLSQVVTRSKKATLIKSGLFFS